ncbi:MAG: 1-acyl-sn-glycerol-3-phosphate acyltransferase [Bacilli bacterium]|nr:1-acyl-sn-glycerol-3-phosphate acyltransferase [Bacilli bacterium]
MKRFIRPVLSIFFPLIKGVLFDIPKLGGKKKDKYELNYRHQKMEKLFRRVNKALRVKYIVLGEDNLPKENALFVSNHLSASDPLILYQTINNHPSTFVAKIELTKLKLIDQAVNAIDGLFMDRNDLRQSLKVMKNVEESLREGKLNWVIYAEGTRNKDSSSLIKEMHYGSFRPAVKANVPIVPIAMFGTNILLKDKPIYKYYPIIFSFLKPIYPNEYEGLRTEEIAKIVESRIQKEISFKLRMLHHQEMLKLNDKRYQPHKLVG